MGILDRVLEGVGMIIDLSKLSDDIRDVLDDFEQYSPCLHEALVKAITKVTDTRVKYVIEISRDGNQWCAMLGSDPVEGEVGFGDTPADALRKLAKAIDVGGKP